MQQATGSDHFIKYVLTNVGVNGTERIIQDVYVGVMVNRSRQADALLLTSAQIHALL